MLNLRVTSTIALFSYATGIAGAQNNICNQLSELVSAASNKFHSVQGKDIGAGVYEAKINLPNATRCYIDHIEGLDSYDCRWDQSDTGSLETNYEAVAAFVPTCMRVLEVHTRSSERVIKEIKYTVSESDTYHVTISVTQSKTSRGILQVGLKVQRFSNS